MEDENAFVFMKEFSFSRRMSMNLLRIYEVS